MEEMYALGLHFTREHEMYYSCNNLVMLVIVASHCPYTNQSK
jgi:glutathione peroxidase-family protein